MEGTATWPEAGIMLLWKIDKPLTEMFWGSGEVLAQHSDD